MKDIQFYCGSSHEAFSPKSIESGIGGSEEMLINLAKELAKNNKVTVWNRCLDDEGVYDGVTYKNYDEFDTKKCDALIVWRLPQLYLKHHLDKVDAKKYLWLHDTVIQLDVIPYIFAFEKIFVVSNWHKSYYIQLMPEEVYDRIYVTRNAVDYSLFDQKIDRDPKTIVYGSLYNRGLKELLTAWPKIKLEVPDAKLRIFYGWQTLEKILPFEQFKMFKDDIELLMAQEGITHLGRISHAEVAKELLGAGIWAYPCLNFNEVSCITAMKAQIAGAVPIIIPRAALNETVRYGIKIGRAQNEQELLDKWTYSVIKVLNDTKGQEAMRRVMQNGVKDSFTYEGLAKDWEGVFNEGN